MTTTIPPSFPTKKRAMRTSPTSSVMSEATKRLEIGPELCSGSPPQVAQGLREHGRNRPCPDCDGAIAQLGERLHGMQEVGGSIPPGSTSLRRLRLLRLGKPSRSEGCRVVARRAKTGLGNPSRSEGCKPSRNEGCRGVARRAKTGLGKPYRRGCPTL